MERVTGSEDIARICEGLSNPYRVEIMKILWKQGEITFRDIIDELEKRGYKGVTNSMVKHHATILGFSGLLTFHRDRVYMIKPLSHITVLEEKL